MTTHDEHATADVSLAAADGRTARTSNQVVVMISGCGLEDEEVFEIADVKAARAAMRKLMASAIRQFGRADAEE
jgi:hypothetical protein